jgi:quercetin dioxygenase-like cupin family protein
MNESKSEIKSNLFPDVITRLPKTNLLLEGAHTYLVQGAENQVIFMEFEQDVILQEHSHSGQYGIVLEGKIELTIDGVKQVFHKGDRYYIPEGAKHSGKIYGGYADITYFDEKNRYRQV